MKFAVVTPYYKEDDKTLLRCINSVKAQSIPVTHFLVSDGFPNPMVTALGLRELRLGTSHRDNGNTPRGLGAQLAVSEGFEGIFFLDADNWYDEDHVDVCLATIGKGPVDYIIARRRFMRPDGTELTGEVEEPLHVDTSCFFILPGAFYTLPKWNLMPPIFSPKCDRFFYKYLLKEQLTAKITPKVTVNFTYLYPGRYLRRGERPPEGVNVRIQAEQQYQRQIKSLSKADLINYSRLTGLQLDK